MGRPVVTAGRTLAALVLLLGASSALRAQEPAKPPDPSKPKRIRLDGKVVTQIEASHALSWEEGNTTVFFLTGGISVMRPDLHLQAARAMVWKSKDSTESFDEIYAEGNVIFTRDTQKMRCERFFWNQVTLKGAVVDLKMKAFSQDLKMDFFATAQQARLQGGEDGRIEAEHMTLSSCSYGVPHYHLTVEQATLLGDEGRAQRGKRFDPWPFESWAMDFDSVVPEFSGMPFLYVPGLAAGPWLMNFPLRSIRFGHSSRYGNFIYSDLGSRIRLRNEHGKLKQWGDIDLKIDYRQVRGMAGGLETRYKWGDYQGYLDSYYLHDDGRNPSSTFDQQFPPLEHDDRGKAHWFHRQDFAMQWRYELEVYYLSDRSLLQEFFPKEFKEEKAPETAAYLRWLQDNQGAFLEARGRLNDFQTQDTYLPRADYNLLSEPIFGGLVDRLYLTERVDAVNIRRKFDEALDLSSVETWRMDALTQVSMPWDFRWFQVAPFVQNRLTWYSNDLDGDDRTRALWTAGARAVAQFHATHADVAWERIGIRGIRHVAEVEIRYANNFSNNVSPDELFPYEPVDQLNRFEELGFELRQRLLTRDAGGSPFEFFSLVLGIEYYPDPNRDTTSANPNTVVPPFNWIPVTLDPSTGGFDPRLWSNFHYEAQLHPRNFFSILLSGEYNFLTHAEEVREWGATVTPFQGLTTFAGQTMVKGVTNAFTLGVTWAMTPKWSVSAFGQYDHRAGEYLKQDLVIARDFHDFSIEGVFERDFTRGDNRFLVSFVPKFLGTAGLNRSHLYRPAGAVGAPSTDR